MQELPEHILLNIATTDPLVWSGLYGTCRRLSTLLHYHHPLWETVFLTKTVKSCHKEYRLKCSGRLHRYGGKPAVISDNCGCTFDLSYVCRDLKDDTRWFKTLGLVKGTSARIYARYGRLHGEIGNRPECEPTALVSFALDDFRFIGREATLAIHCTRGCVVDKVVTYNEGKRKETRGSILIDNNFSLVSFISNWSHVVVIPTRPGWSDFVKMVTFMVICHLVFS